MDLAPGGIHLYVACIANPVAADHDYRYSYPYASVQTDNQTLLRFMRSLLAAYYVQIMTSSARNSYEQKYLRYILPPPCDTAVSVAAPTTLPTPDRTTGSLCLAGGLSICFTPYYETSTYETIHPLNKHNKFITLRTGPPQRIARQKNGDTSPHDSTPPELALTLQTSDPPPIFTSRMRQTHHV